MDIEHVTLHSGAPAYVLTRSFSFFEFFLISTGSGPLAGILEARETGWYNSVARSPDLGKEMK